MKTWWKFASFVVGGVVVVALTLALLVRSGAYNIGADDEHTRPVHSLMEAVRERSIEAHARQIAVPDLKDPMRAQQGAGNYSAMCVGCHLSPGRAATELSRGLYPAPPDLSKEKVDPAQAFWVIKHGIKASGMPAWGKSMGDDYIWNMVAFLQVMPTLDAASYEGMVEKSGGHSHGGTEDKPHSHDAAEGTPHSHNHDDEAKEAEPTSDEHQKKAATKVPHTHPPGTKPHHD